MSTVIFSVRIFILLAWSWQWSEELSKKGLALLQATVSASYLESTDMIISVLCIMVSEYPPVFSRIRLHTKQPRKIGDKEFSEDPEDS